MGLVETDSLILKSYSLAEADKIIVFLTKEQGLVRGVARGAKRLKSRFGSGLEPFSIVRLHYFQKEEKELVTISQIELIQTFFQYTTNPEILQKFSYLADLLTNFAPPHQSDERLYRMATICFNTAVENQEYLEHIVFYFELWILRLGGFLPGWKICNICQRILIENEATSLQGSFHLICSACQKSQSNLIITPKIRRIFLDAQIFSPEKFIEVTKDKKEEIIDLSRLLKRQISTILGKESIGESFLSASPR